MAEETAKQKATISMAQAIGFSITILGAVIGAWSTTQTRITILEMQMKNGDIDRSRIENKIDRINLKMDDMTEKVNDIKVMTTTKADKK